MKNTPSSTKPDKAAYGIIYRQRHAHGMNIDTRRRMILLPGGGAWLLTPPVQRLVTQYGFTCQYTIF